MRLDYNPTRFNKKKKEKKKNKMSRESAYRDNVNLLFIENFERFDIFISQN